MPTMREAMEWLRSSQQTHDGESITYSRVVGGTSYSVTLTAVVGASRSVQTDTNGRLRIEYQDRDYLITASALILNSETATPKRGDRITDAAGVVWEVQPTETEPPVRPSDSYGYRWRVHCKRVS